MEESLQSKKLTGFMTRDLPREQEVCFRISLSPPSGETELSLWMMKI